MLQDILLSHNDKDRTLKIMYCYTHTRKTWRADLKLGTTAPLPVINKILIEFGTETFSDDLLVSTDNKEEFDFI